MKKLTMVLCLVMFFSMFKCTAMVLSSQSNTTMTNAIAINYGDTAIVQGEIGERYYKITVPYNGTLIIDAEAKGTTYSSKSSGDQLRYQFNFLDSTKNYGYVFFGFLQYPKAFKSISYCKKTII